MYRSSYRGKRRSGLTATLFFYTGLVMLVLSVAIYLFSPPIRFVALIVALLGGSALLYAGLKYASENTSFQFAAMILLNIMRAIFLILLVSFIVVESLIIFGGASDVDAANADYLIVLGAGVNGTEPSLSLWSRLTVALKYLSNNPDCVAILSGGQGPGEDITEAECMRRYLEERNIAPERLILEQYSTDTIQNITNSLFLISADIANPPESHDLPREVSTASGVGPGSGFEVGDAKIAVLSNEFHLYRAVTIGRNEGVRLQAVSAPSPRIDLMIAYHIREYFSVMKVFLTYLFI